MKNCKECIHNDFCNVDGYIDADDCTFYKNKADVVEVKHGEYIYSSTDDKWHCSECFAERPRNNGDIPYSDIYCCYKCCAIMDGKEEDK